MADNTILALDQGTTSTRALIFNDKGKVVASASRELEQIYPEAGWVEHDATAIFNDAVVVIEEALSAHDGPAPLAMGITNQRETIVLWDRKTGEPVANAIVWQDRRTAAQCEELRQAVHEEAITEKTGLLLDPYFSATKLAWLLENTKDGRRRADDGELLAGTIDSWLLWKLTGGAIHATDVTNASRTMLANIHTATWDQDLLDLFEIPQSMLPEIRPNQHNFGLTSGDQLGAEFLVCALAGDQQAAAYGQACFDPGAIKATFGTGCFVLVNTGDKVVTSKNKMLATALAQTGDGTRYALEGSAFMAGATIQWLRDNLQIIASSQVTEALAKKADPDSGAFLVPAFQGLGAPHWAPEARAVIGGLTRATGRAEIVRAGLEGVAFQTFDLLTAINADLEANGIDRPDRLKVDGGMARNEWFLQFLADILDMPVDRAAQDEATALGVAWHAGITSGQIKSEKELQNRWKADKSFEPEMESDEREHRLEGWERAIKTARSA